MHLIANGLELPDGVLLSAGRRPADSKGFDEKVHVVNQGAQLGAERYSSFGVRVVARRQVQPVNGRQDAHGIRLRL